MLISLSFSHSFVLAYSHMKRSQQHKTILHYPVLSLFWRWMAHLSQPKVNTRYMKELNNTVILQVLYIYSTIFTCGGFPNHDI